MVVCKTLYTISTYQNCLICNWKASSSLFSVFYCQIIWKINIVRITMEFVSLQIAMFAKTKQGLHNVKLIDNLMIYLWNQRKIMRFLIILTAWFEIEIAFTYIHISISMFLSCFPPRPFAINILLGLLQIFVWVISNYSSGYVAKGQLEICHI